MSLFSDEIQPKFGLLVHPTSPLHQDVDVKSPAVIEDTLKEGNSGGGELFTYILYDFSYYSYIYLLILSLWLGRKSSGTVFNCMS